MIAVTVTVVMIVKARVSVMILERIPTDVVVDNIDHDERREPPAMRRPVISIGRPDPIPVVVNPAPVMIGRPTPWLVIDPRPTVRWDPTPMPVTIRRPISVHAN